MWERRELLLLLLLLIQIIIIIVFIYSYMAKRPFLDAEGPSDSKEIPRSLDPVLSQMCPRTEPCSETDVSSHWTLFWDRLS